MELRSARHKRLAEEFKELKYSLTSMGLFENGMKLEEMRQIITVVQESTAGTSCFLETDMERAIKESELDFAPNQDNLLHSTMIQNQNVPDVLPISASTNKSMDCSSPFSSPEIPAKISTISAEVHHAMNWSPKMLSPPLPAASFSSSDANLSQRKRVKNTHHEDTIESDAKRSHMSPSSSPSCSFVVSQISATSTQLSKRSSHDSGIYVSYSSDTDTSTKIII